MKFVAIDNKMQCYQIKTCLFHWYHLKLKLTLRLALK
jgi:hypothetical protein